MNPVRVYLLSGDDEYRVSHKAQQTVNALVPQGNEAFGLEVIDGQAETIAGAEQIVDRCADAVCTRGFLAGDKVVWLRGANFLGGDTPLVRAEGVKTRLAALAALFTVQTPPQAVLIVTAARIDKRSSFYKALEGVGEVQQFAVPEKSFQQAREARKTLQVLLRREGLRMPEDAIGVFLERVGTDTRQIVNEVEKLAVFLAAGREASRADVEAVVCASRELMAWDLADAFGARDLSKAVRTLRQLLFQRVAPVLLLRNLERRIRELMIVQQALQARWLSVRTRGDWTQAEWTALPVEAEQQLEDILGRGPRAMHPFRLSTLACQASRFSLAELVCAQELVLKAHEHLVSKGIPADIVLELLLARIVPGSPGPAATGGS